MALKDYLFSGNSIKLALEDVSKNKMNTIFSEYPILREPILAFQGMKIEYSLDQVEELFASQGLVVNDVEEVVKELVDIGFFQEKKGEITMYWIPFIFRPFLGIT